MTQLSTVSHCAFVRARSGYAAELGLRLNDLIAPSRRAPGCVRFSLQRSHRDEELWLVSGFWCSQQAMDDYFQSPAMQVFTDLVNLHLVRSLDLHTFDEVKG